jgi:hypothetical protein
LLLEGATVLDDEGGRVGELLLEGATVLDDEIEGARDGDAGANRLAVNENPANSPL